MAKVTVLMACWNAAEYVEKALDSLLCQTYRDFQVVCVDDASTDNTLDILRQYAAKDSRIHVVSLSENGGQAHARNVALARAEGEYVCMLDSDDWMSPDALEQAVAVFETHPDADCVLFQVEEVYADHARRYPLPAFERMTGVEAFEASLTWALHGLYMVRADMHRKYPFDETSRAYSDDNTTRIHYLHSREVRQCGGVYYYRQHETSVTHGVSVRRFDYLRANESMRRQMEKAGADDRLLGIYEKIRWLNLIDTYMFYYCHGKELSDADRAYGLAEMRRVWRNIETWRIPRNLRLKPGYIPLRPWWLFRLQEEGYFTLRKWMGKNR
ncbi:MAG: glycosyltransferase family 2 protein [Prevotella sp.]|nr:glycosyltransferase family 2 protein [Prevotella sp.]